MADEIPNTVEWRAIAGYPDYEAGSDGRIHRITRPKSTRWKNRPLPFDLTPNPGDYGYMLVVLTARDGKRRMFRVNRLICAAFHGDPPSDKHEAAHGDGNRSNNAASNLRWATTVENEDDKKRHETHFRAKGILHGQAKLTEDQVKEIIVSPRGYGTGVALARKFGVTKSAIYEIRWGINWRHIPR